MSQPLIGKLAIYGVGLIGGSFALALKAAGAVGKVVGQGRSRANLDLALEAGAIDAVARDDRDAVADADLVLLAMPVGQMTPVMRRIAPWLGAHTVVTDAGSTKRDVIALACEHLHASAARFVPAHPIAGAERSGAGAARAELFRDRHLILTPIAGNDPQAVALVRRAWEIAGMRVSSMDAQRHDEVLAAVSHLPHVLSYALVHELAGRADAEHLFALAAGGFRDFTRIAGSSPEMWRDICVSNRDLLLEELARYRAELERLAALLQAADGPGLEALFSAARDARNRWLQIR
ncbi:MAG: prephenate dehydrogenase/arogenate dehydrogenase family protein [Betaproteobacteria bacterium]|nr:prephenate dehydrogenase/arogenate dehydrogenase family protein [Betaproteobacteria bacterium]